MRNVFLGLRVGIHAIIWEHVSPCECSQSPSVVHRVRKCCTSFSKYPKLNLFQEQCTNLSTRDRERNGQSEDWVRITCSAPGHKVALQEPAHPKNDLRLLSSNAHLAKLGRRCSSLKFWKQEMLETRRRKGIMLESSQVQNTDYVRFYHIILFVDWKAAHGMTLDGISRTSWAACSQRRVLCTFSSWTTSLKNL